MSFAFGGGTASPSDQPNQSAQNPPKVEPSTPYIAAGDGNLELLQTALRTLNLAANAADSNGFTFVHAAAAYNRLNVLRWLFNQEGINVNAQDADGDTPLHHCDEVEAAKCLIEEGKADIAIKNANGYTAREAKEEELLEDQDEDEEEDSDDEDRIAMKALVEYLKSLEGGTDDQDMQ
mmetsp:Transcript_10044/g.16618  ORF Transcript_10044/g.16618 Transcript_10044/m.16618 type:complete len:178 (-) Transcript_10044:132-665(-)|eukprot:CAMPEP_0197717884 /NCGR_PEP_ID=MMETSP1434-20131217/2256_1 /TAXON_ID=265543 /ORGANISM="Minutocellus polymorphus, Strain CCMP3303" /LENGTH=177 /DNA_ID=CAMNT_0043302465 /DNA_START=26 /DNA_END=559 /DNA_ORIENTATION=+